MFGCFSFKSGKLLLTEFLVNRIAGSLGPSATIPIRACLRAHQLDWVVVRPAGVKVIPELAESLPLIRVHPDHQTIPTADSSGIDIATPDPFLESAVSPPPSSSTRSRCHYCLDESDSVLFQFHRRQREKHAGRRTPLCGLAEQERALLAYDRLMKDIRVSEGTE